jgi:hypothetical protein
MRISVLLPTREGGPLLDGCIRSVLSQAGDFELVVADNANTDETPAVLESHSSDERLVVTRSERPLPVTENWRAALERSSGDYVVLLNDDDILLPGYFDRAEALLRAHGDPDCLTCASTYYIFPDAALGARQSYFRDPAYPAEGVVSEGEVSAVERRRRVGRMFRDFGLAHCFPSMQRTLISRAAIDRLRAGLFQPPFPDLYAMAALCLTAERWAVTPERLLVTGASSGSFWHLTFTGRLDEGVRYLGNEEATGPLPGDHTLNTMLANLEALKRDYPDLLGGVEPNRTLYVVRQIWSWIRGWRGGTIGGRELARRLRSLSGGDIGRLALAPFQSETRQVARASLRARRRGETMIQTESFRPAPGVGGISEFAQWLGANESQVASGP